jgi:hypothetical protein
MWWLLTQRGRRCLRMSLIDQQVQLKFNAIGKICKYIRLHEGHHYILITMEVHSAPRRDMDRFIRECVRIFHMIKRSFILVLLHSIF